MSDTVHISSLLLRADPARLDAVCKAVLQEPEAEIAQTSDEGHIIVTLETESEARIVDALTRMNLIDGVVSAALVYHQTDTEGSDTAA